MDKLKAAIAATLEEFDRRGMRAASAALERQLHAGDIDEDRLTLFARTGINELRLRGLEHFAQGLEVDLGWREEVTAGQDEPYQHHNAPPEPTRTIDLQEGLGVGDQVAAQLIKEPTADSTVTVYQGVPGVTYREVDGQRQRSRTPDEGDPSPWELVPEGEWPEEAQNVEPPTPAAE